MIDISFVRLGLYAAAATAILSGVLYVGYVFHDRDRLATELKMSEQNVKMLASELDEADARVERADTATLAAKKRAEKSNETMVKLAKEIHDAAKKDDAPAALPVVRALHGVCELEPTACRGAGGSDTPNGAN